MMAADDREPRQGDDTSVRVALRDDLVNACLMTYSNNKSRHTLQYVVTRNVVELCLFLEDLIEIRPPNAREKIDMCQICTSVMPGEPQVVLGKDKAFTFDYVFDTESVQSNVYNSCTHMLVEGCFEGYNATVFAYGQTGSGKTFTMGTGFDLNITEKDQGIVPRAVRHLFDGIQKRKEAALLNKQPLPIFKVTVQFMELYNEEILDLLDPAKDPESRNRKSHIKVHEDASGGIYVVGVNTRPVDSMDATIQILKGGALSRATACTKMNVQSSRSHAIFTLHVKQDRITSEELLSEDGKEQDSSQPSFETLTAKFHFVDLAGSERLKRTGATGERAKEGISINCGLLALGNVISALGDKTKRGCHVPYRDSKLTRLLQDSLGGNSRTLMIACISPTDRDFMETLNTLKYANRAKNIQNKVIANQDKASKQLAMLRTEVAALQRELAEYKSGKRIIDTDGVEGISDLVHENTMLQTANDKMRQRIKALNEAIDDLILRNSTLLAERAVLMSQGSGEINNEKVTEIVQGYSKELEELRAKLVESEAMCKITQAATARARSHFTLSPAVPMTGGTDVPTSSMAEVGELLKAAKKEVRQMKRKISSRDSQESDKENISDSELLPTMAGGEGVADAMHLNSDEECLAGEDMIEEDDVDDLELLNSDSESDDESSENIHENLAELTCEISIKQRLIEELEQTQNKLHAVKCHYDQKMMQLQQKIRETEIERDTILANMNKVELDKRGYAQKVQSEYEKKLNELQSELKKFQEAKKEHNKLLRNQAHYEKQLKGLQHDLQEMKKTKVKMLKQIKEEAEKGRHNKARQHKEITQLRKEHLKKENKIRVLELEKRQKEMILRRKQEEVEALRKRQRPMSSRAAGRVGKYNMQPTVPAAQVPMSAAVRRKMSANASHKLIKRKWDGLEKMIENVILNRQTLSLMEKDMNTWLKQRNKLGQSLEKYARKRDMLIIRCANEEEIKESIDVIESLNMQLDSAHENINEIQAQIMQLEENKDGGNNEKIDSLINKCTSVEAVYLLNRLLQMVFNKGISAAQRDTEIRELQAKLHQSMVNNTLQQDLLKHMMADHVDFEVDDLVQNDDAESSMSSGSSSPVERPHQDAAHHTVVHVSSPLHCGGMAAKMYSAGARRRTATPIDLLYPDANSEDSPLVSIMESSRRISDELPTSPQGNEESKDAVSVGDESSRPGVSCDTRRPNLASVFFDPALSPIIKRRGFCIESRMKSYSRHQTEEKQSASKRKWTYSGSDASPPTSPPMLRQNSKKIDVFNRLTCNTMSASPGPNRGSITQFNRCSSSSSGRMSPLVCSHVVEGHTKPVLAVFATENLLFTSSKDRTAKVWDLKTGIEMQTFAGHPNNVVAVKYNEKTQVLYTVSHSEIRVWDIRQHSGCSIATLKSSGLVSSPVMHSARQLETMKGEPIISDIVINEEGTALFSASGNTVRLWDLRSYSSMGKLSGGQQAQIMVLALTNRMDKNIVISGSKDHYIKVYEVIDTAVGLITPKYNLEPPHYDGVQSLTIQGDVLFSGSRDRCIKKWDLTNQQMIQSLSNAHKDWVCALSCMPEYNVMLSGCRSGYVKLWQVDDCRSIGEIKAHNSPINSIVTNSSAIFTASNDCSVGIWKRRSSLEIYHILTHGRVKQT